MDRVIRTTCSPVVLAILVLCVAVPARGADPGRIVGLLEQYNELSKLKLPQPLLEESELEELARGELVRKRWKIEVDGESRHRVIGVSVVAQPRPQLWLAALFDPMRKVSDRLTESDLVEDDKGGGSKYQHLDLPGVLLMDDRQWIIGYEMTPVAERSGGNAWEQIWDLVGGGPELALELATEKKLKNKQDKLIGVKQVKKAVYLPANVGAWAMFDLGEGSTLVFYQVTVDLGGWIPEGPVASQAMRGLQDLFSEIEQNAKTVNCRYGSDSGTFAGFDGNGKRIEKASLPPCKS